MLERYAVQALLLMSAHLPQLQWGALIACQAVVRVAAWLTLNGSWGMDSCQVSCPQIMDVIIESEFVEVTPHFTNDSSR